MCFSRLFLPAVIFIVLCGLQTPCGLASPTSASVKNDPSGLIFWSSTRFRYEFQDNFNIKSYGKQPVVGEEDDSFLLGRFRFGIKGRLWENIYFSVGVQHADVWDLAVSDDDFYNGPFGRENNPYKDDLEPFNTYLLFKDFLYDDIDFKIGRQLIYYGNKRIFGPGQWGNTGRWIWDAAKLHYGYDHGFIDLYYGKTMIHEPNELSITHNHGFESIGLYSHVQLPEKFKGIVIEPFAMTKHSDGNDFIDEHGRQGELDSYYVGLRIAEQDHEAFDWDATYIMQQGDYADDDLEAYGYHVSLTYNWNALPWRPRTGIDYSYASGDDDPTDGEINTFDSAFGARDKMYGRMNLFHWKNLKDAELHMSLHPHPKWKLVTRFHSFWLAEEEDAWYLNPKAYRDRTGNSGDEVGKELDIICIWNLHKKHQIQFGFGYFWPDEFAENLASDDEAAWGFLQWQWQFDQKIL